jgi:hypothetical protein
MISFSPGIAARRQNMQKTVCFLACTLGTLAVQATPLPFGQFTTTPAGWLSACGPYIPPCTPDVLFILPQIENTPFVAGTTVRATFRIGATEILGVQTATLQPYSPGFQLTGLGYIAFHSAESIIDWNSLPEEWHHQEVSFASVLAGCPEGCYIQYELLSGSSLGFGANHILGHSVAPDAVYSARYIGIDLGLPGEHGIVPPWAVPEPSTAALASAVLAVLTIRKKR